MIIVMTRRLAASAPMLTQPPPEFSSRL